jgi:hypothetical protein
MVPCNFLVLQDMSELRRSVPSSWTPGSYKCSVSLRAALTTLGLKLTFTCALGLNSQVVPTIVNSLPNANHWSKLLGNCI